MRVGFGYDSHAFSEGDHLWIGGVKIPFSEGVRSHSDGDVLLHALIDAMLGAAALGDIGRHFPDTDPAFKNINSSKLVRETLAMIKGQSLELNNIDATIIVERPRLATYMNEMVERLSDLTELTTKQINIKAKTNEKMGWIGRGEGIAACVIVSLAKSG